MKKLVSGLLLSTLLLAACGDTQEAPEDTTTDDAAVEETTDEAATGGLQDGTYTVADTQFGETGWKEDLEVTVSGGEITDATWTSVNEDGLNKLEDDEYQEAMAGAVEVGPQDFIPALEEDLVAKQDPAEVEVITGATGTSEKFKDYAGQAVAAAEEGNEETIEVYNSAE